METSWKVQKNHSISHCMSCFMNPATTKRFEHSIAKEKEGKDYQNISMY